MSYLFAYGTLRKDFDSEIKDQISSRLQFICKAKVKADMYDLGTYPGAVKTKRESEIVGDIFWMDDVETVLKRMDEYEGEEYVRKKTRVTLRNGNSMMAWMYWYVGNIEGKHRIRYKDYFNYLKNKKSALINGAL